MGTSGAIFSAQTSAFRSKISPDKHTFDFVDAPFDSPPAAGVEAFFKPPNYAFWKGVDPAAVRESHKWLSNLPDRQGPYDALIGFSQGCSLISTFILHHNNENPEEPLPFKAAMFICGGVPLAWIADMGLPVPPEAWAINERTGKELREKAGSAVAEIQAIMEGGLEARRGLWDRTDTLEHDPLAEFPEDRSNVFGLDFEVFPETLRIGIPTVHIYGSKDPRYPASMQLVHFAEEGRRKVYDHGGGHDLPRTTVVSNKVAELVDWMDEMVREEERGKSL
ncbi:MAG: hypothetical protein LQ342_000227 [Letrouitia transgressa]|nr:MAG: hypothetical protein LQ342_000227 [Letrouitia transgressa]